MRLRGFDDVAGRIAAVLRGPAHLRLGQVQQPLPIGQLPRPIRPQLQRFQPDWELPVHDHLSQVEEEAGSSPAPSPGRDQSTLTLEVKSRAPPTSRLRLATDRGVARLMDSDRVEH